MQGRPRLRERLTTLVPGMTGPSPASTPGWGHVVDDAVHRAIVVVDIAESTAPIRRNSDRVLIRQTMYRSLTSAFRWRDWVKCYYKDRGDGVLLLGASPGAEGLAGDRPAGEAGGGSDPPHAAMAQQNPARRAATEVRLRVAVNAGEVTFDRHGVVGAAIDDTFRMADAEPLKKAFAKSDDACGLIVSDWFYRDVVYHHADARPDSYQPIDCRVKQASISAWMRVPGT